MYTLIVITYLSIWYITVEPIQAEPGPCDAGGAGYLCPEGEKVNHFKYVYTFAYLAYKM